MFIFFYADDVPKIYYSEKRTKRINDRAEPTAAGLGLGLCVCVWGGVGATKSQYVCVYFFLPNGVAF